MTAIDHEQQERQQQDRRDLERMAIREQHGVILRHQAVDAGMRKQQIDRRVRRGQWVSGPTRDTLILASSSNDPLAQLYAATTSPGAIAWADSSLALRDLGGHPPRPIVATARRRSSTHVDYRVTQDWDRLPVSTRHGIPTASLEIALATIAADRSKRVVDDVIDEALRRGLTTWTRVQAAIEQFLEVRRPGSRLLRQILADRGHDAATPLSIWSRDVGERLERSGLPHPKYEYRVMNNAGYLVAQVDLAYPELKLAIELDSIRYHLNLEAFNTDHRRDSDLAQCGWLVARFTWRQFTEDWPWMLKSIKAHRGLAVVR